MRSGGRRPELPPQKTSLPLSLSNGSATDKRVRIGPKQTVRWRDLNRTRATQSLSLRIRERTVLPTGSPNPHLRLPLITPRRPRRAHPTRRKRPELLHLEPVREHFERGNVRAARLFAHVSECPPRRCTTRHSAIINHICARFEFESDKGKTPDGHLDRFTRRIRSP